MSQQFRNLGTSYANPITPLKAALSSLLSVRTLLILLAAGLLAYTALRAATLSMTHDESSTYLNTLPVSVWGCFFDADCWQTANLHMTNTLFMQGSVALFGSDEWAVRLPNVLGHLVYLIFSILLVWRLTEDSVLRVAGFLLLNANPYLLDFFSLARGYGLANVGMMVSLYYLLRYLQQPGKGYAWGCALGAAFAVMSNFTWLIYFAALGAAIFLLITADPTAWRNPRLLFQGDAPDLRKRWQALLPWLIVAGVMGAFLYFPVTQLSKLGEFKYGTDSLWQSFHHLISDSVYGESYFSGQTIRVFKGLTLVLSLAALAFGIRSLWQKNPAPATRYFQLVCALVILILLGMVVQYYLLGAQYVIHRKSLLFIPLGGLLLLLLFQEIQPYRPVIVRSFAIMIAVFAGWHFSRFANLQFVREWYYDAGTRDMVYYVQQKVLPGEKVNLGMHWLYTHTANFYVETEQLDFLEPIVYSKDLRTDDLYDYYYVQPGDGGALDSAYVLEQQFRYVGNLYKRNTPAPAQP